VLFVCCDGLKGFAQAIESAFPKATVQTCIVHQVRNSLAFVSWKDRRTVLPDIKAIYRAETVEGAAARLDRASLQALAKRIFTSDPRRAIRSLLQGDLARLFAGPDQARVLDRLQSAMSVVEGHAEHVMDAAAATTDPGYARLRERLDARRARRGGLGEIISRLLGMELKLRQYKLGKAFCDAVAAEGGVEGLNRVWAAPEALPIKEELERPELWLERVGASAAASAS
jgi:putative hydrolase